MKALLEIIERILFFYFAFFALFNLVLAVASKLKKSKKQQTASNYNRFAILIPGYKEDNIILETAQSAFNQNYPKDKFSIIVIADHFLPETIEKLKQLPLKLIETKIECSTKAKAINAAFNKLNENDFDSVLILDADNIMDKNFLSYINNSFAEGYFAIQGHRVAKNLNSKMAILDAISEEINNNLFRKGSRALGLSSAIIGSGMAFNYLYFKELMANIYAVGGLDKEIELKMLREGKTIQYLDNAYIYDEKVAQLSVFYKQRRRWLSSQIHYLNKYFFDAVIQLFREGNIDYFVKALQMAQPPRLFLLALSFIVTVIVLIANSNNLATQWSVLLLIIIATLLLATPKHYYTKGTLIALLLLPKTFIVMFYSLLTIRKANNTFIHTPHTANFPHNFNDKNKPICE